MAKLVDLLPGISGALGLGGSLLNFASQRETNSLQRDLYEDQKQFMLSMYDRQLRDTRAWENENARRNRLLNAGLNPALAFSDSASPGSVGVPSAPSAPSLTAPQTSFSDVALNAASVIGSLAAAGKSDEEARGVRIDNQTRAAKNLLDLESIDSNRQLTDEQRRYVRVMAAIQQHTLGSQVYAASLANEETRQRISVLNEQAKNLASQSALNDCEAILKGLDIKYRPIELRAAIDSAYAQMRLMASQSNLSDEQAANIFLQSVGQCLDNTSKSDQIALYRKTMPLVIRQARQNGILNSQQIYLNRQLINQNSLNYAGSMADILLAPVNKMINSISSGAAGFAAGRLGGKTGKGVTYGINSPGWRSNSTHPVFHY